jgi:hypothetical protein
VLRHDLGDGTDFERSCELHASTKPIDFDRHGKLSPDNHRSLEKRAYVEKQHARVLAYRFQSQACANGREQAEGSASVAGSIDTTAHCVAAQTVAIEITAIISEIRMSLSFNLSFASDFSVRKIPSSTELTPSRSAS